MVRQVISKLVVTVIWIFAFAEVALRQIDVVKWREKRRSKSNTPEDASRELNFRQ